VAAVFHYNRNYLGRVFKEEVGMSIAQYLMQVRLERARELLSATHLPVIEIAERCGFGGVSYFNRAFKAEEGITPTEYRRANTLLKPR
jgi:AraC-like DNA-binding protein